MTGGHARVDLLLRGGRVVDGTGAPWRHADVLVGNGLIAGVVPPGRFDGEVDEVIDADGLVVAPGFVDIHSHSDLALLARPGAEEKLRQGVTTEVVGNCGISVAPVTAEHLLDCQQYAHPVLAFEEIEWDWTDTAGYLERIERAGPAVNVATYVGLGTVRCAVSAFDPTAPNPERRRTMRELTRQALAQGAVGVSTGLVYAPGSYASDEEICELVDEAARVGALYSSHMRDQGDGFLESVAETLDVGRRTGAAVQIAHHKVVGPRNWGQVSTSLAMLRAARAEGIDAGSDVYPYLAGSTTMTALLPDWTLVGGRHAMLRRLADPTDRERIKRDWVQGIPLWDNRVASLGWDNIYIAHVATDVNQDVVGLSVAAAAVARQRGADPGDFLLDLLLDEQGAVGNVQMACAEDDLRLVMSDPTTTFGSDGLYAGRRPHPRLHGTFPRILGEYVRETGLLTLEEAISKMTSRPARRLGLDGIGLIEPGYAADLVVLNAHTVAGPADYDRPTLHPRGIQHVLVSGRVALRDGDPTGVRAGRPLRRNQTGLPAPAGSDHRNLEGAS
ncbi:MULTISPECIES: D-aminoacylase [unclassified Nocardioides]|uniref:N-acyl-D-amino-acid deacylase family protein n=1 Tax=unclassified Nocardioides TaxID=2615069 RepID=UPI000056F9DE|nr:MULTISPECIES: D-aminoacylase [unclassified Nocardioides]ABL80931.1 dihydroorotase [Nocardioides sp. JS614]